MESRRPLLTAVINLNGALILSPVNLQAGWEHQHQEQRDGRPDAWARGLVPEAGTGSYKLGIEFREASVEFWGAHYNSYAEKRRNIFVRKFLFERSSFQF